MVSQGPKLIGFGKSRAFRCLWALEELGIPYQHIPVKPHSEEAKQHNPLGKIPILVDEEGFCIYETNAIIGYLCDTNSEKNLIPTPGTKQRGLYEQTMSVLATELDSQSLWIHMKHKLMADKFGEIPDAVEHARNYFNKTNKTLIQQLKDKSGGTEETSYILGPDFSAADIVYVHCLDWSKLIGWDTEWKDDEVVTNYINACHSRDAFSRAFQKREALKL